MICDKLSISDIRIHTRFCSCVRFHKYRSVRFWILDSEYILALTLKRKILNALTLYCQSLNTLALNSYIQDALVFVFLFHKLLQSEFYI